MATDDQDAAVSDARPITHLDEISCLDVMEGFSSLLIPKLVWRETLCHRPGLSLLDVPGARLVDDAELADSVAAVACRTFDLDAGERSAIGVAFREGVRLLLCHDAAARTVVEMLGLRVHGTIGLLIRAIRRQTRTLAEVRRLIASLSQRSSLHLCRALLDRVLAQLPSA